MVAQFARGALEREQQERYFCTCKIGCPSLTARSSFLLSRRARTSSQAAAAVIAHEGSKAACGELCSNVPAKDQVRASYSNRLAGVVEGVVRAAAKGCAPILYRRKGRRRD